VVFALVGCVSHIFTKFYSLPCIFAFAFCVGTFQLQDWLRRYYFLYNKGKLAIISDFISYGVQFVLLLVLWRIGQLTLFRTFLCMCLTSVAAVIMGPFTDQFRPATGRLRETWAQCRHLSRDLLIASQVNWLGTQGLLLIGTWVVGTSAIGGLRATYTLAGPVYLVLSSLDNVIPMQVAGELKRKGTAGAYVFIQRAIYGGMASLGLLLLPIGIFGRPILKAVYGPDVVAFYVPMLLQLLGMVMQIPSRLWGFLYRGLQDTQALVRANALSATTSIATVYWFGHLWDASGVALSGLCSQLLVVVYCIHHWMRHREDLLLRYLPEGSARSQLPTVALENEYAEQ
jgi:hypothetical protein